MVTRCRFREQVRGFNQFRTQGGSFKQIISYHRLGSIAVLRRDIERDEAVACLSMCRTWVERIAAGSWVLLRHAGDSSNEDKSFGSTQSEFPHHAKITRIRRDSPLRRHRYCSCGAKSYAHDYIRVRMVNEGESRGLQWYRGAEVIVAVR